MTNVQIIIDYGNSLKALTCTGASIQTEEHEPSIYDIYSRAKTTSVTCTGMVLDESPNLISLPDELLLRIRDYNIDTEHQNKIAENNKLEEKIASLKDQVAGLELRRNLIQEEVYVYEQVLREICDDHPKLAMDVAARLGHLDLTLYLAKQTKEKEEEEK